MQRENAKASLTNVLWLVPQTGRADHPFPSGQKGMTLPNDPQIAKISTWFQGFPFVPAILSYIISGGEGNGYLKAYSAS